MPISGRLLRCWRRPGACTALAAALALSGCGSSGPYLLPFMPAPDIYADQIVDPFVDLSPIEIEDGNAGILYVTSRGREENSGQVAYTSQRGYVMRAGSAKVQLGSGDYSWDEARRISLLKNRTEEYPLAVTEVDEYGVMAESIGPLQTAENLKPGPSATDRLIEQVQVQLDRSRVKEINIYVHGYKVVFENPILVSAELWHYLGYEGAFIAFSWPSTPKRTAYFGDSATAGYSGAQLRQLLTILADRTSARRINIIGYSAGTRVVVNAIDQLNMLAQYADAALRERYLRIGHVILVGADADRDNFARFIGEDGLEVADDITVYTSDSDKALGLSSWLLAGQNRLGQKLEITDVSQRTLGFLSAHPSLRIVSVAGAENASSGNGHAYFRQSPWVSGDILMTLRYNLPPAARGLMLQDGISAWKFPPDYLSRLRLALADMTRQPLSADAR